MKKKNIIAFGIEVIAVLVLAAVVTWIAGYGVMPQVSYVKSQMYEFYNTDDVDTVFVGSSMVYRAVNPEVVDELSGTKSFNLGTSSQKPIDSYFMVKEAVRTHNIKCVVLDVSQNFFLEGEYLSQNTSTYLVYDRMENSSVKTEYFNSAFSLDEKPYAIFAASHYDVGSISSFLDNLKAAFKDNGEPEKIAYETEWYAGSGFVESTLVYDGSSQPAENNGSEFDEESIGWLRKTIEFCQSNDVEIIITSSPKTADWVESFTYYSENYEKLKNIISEYGLEYYDANMDNDFHAKFTNECFVDNVHLNVTGAAVYSEYVAGLIGK